MSDLNESKADVIDEILPIRDLLREHMERLASQPRSTTATRQLAVIIKKLEGWHEAFSLTPVVPVPPPVPSREELISELIAMVDKRIEAWTN